MTTDEALKHAIEAIKDVSGIDPSGASWDDKAVKVLTELRQMISTTKDLALTPEEVKALRRVHNDNECQYPGLREAVHKVLTLNRVAAV